MVQMHMHLLILCVIAKEAIQLLVEEASFTQRENNTLQVQAAVKARFLSLTYVRSSSSL